MSFWCRERAGWLAALILPAFAATGQAQQLYFQPQAEIGVEDDTNRNLVPSGDHIDKRGNSAGYSVDAIGIAGIATPLTDTTIRPEVSYADYPHLGTDDLRTLLDLNSAFHSERGQGDIEGRFDRESTTSSELANPLFNLVNPNLPTTPETGRVTTNTTRTLFMAVPTYTFDLSQRLNWGVQGTYQNVGYSGSNAGAYIPFEYYLGGTSLGWNATPRFGVAFGAFASRESAKNGSGSVDAAGGTVTFDYKWSTQVVSHLQVSGERDDSSVVKPIEFKNTNTGIGATYSTTWTGQISKLQLTLGRTFTPSGAGGTFRADQLQIEYMRDLTQRLALTAAARVINETSLSRAYLNGDYNYVNFETRLKWKLTPVWYVAGGVQYLHEHFEPPVGAAANAMLYASFGYLGLGKPQ